MRARSRTPMVPASSPPLHRLLPVRLRNEEVAPPEPALLHHLNPVVDSAQVFVGVVRTERELHPGALRCFDEPRTRDAVVVIDLDRDVVLLGGLDYSPHALRSPQLVIIPPHLLPQHRRFADAPALPVFPNP